MIEHICRPEDLFALRDTNMPARTRFDAVPPSHPRDYIKWVKEARRAETLQRRIAETARKVAGDND